jgi:hypothetical protein
MKLCVTLEYVEFQKTRSNSENLMLFGLLFQQKLISPRKKVINLWRPIFIIELFVIVLWREFNCVKIPQGAARQINPRIAGLIYAPKVE